MSTDFKDGVLILECLDKADPGSEGRFLSHMFDIMEVNSQYVEIRTKKQFLSMMISDPFSNLHVTTHGRVPERKFVGFWTPDGTAKQKDFAGVHLEGQVVVSTACKSGSIAFKRAIVDDSGAKHYIAPKKSPYFRSSIFFAHIFYHYTFVLKLAPDKAIEKYRKGYKNPHDFGLIA